MRQRTSQLGFTLVELMVALVIGLLVMAGAIQIFVMTKRSFSELDSLASRQEAIRFVTDVMGADIRTSNGISVVEYRQGDMNYQNCGLPDPDNDNESVVVKGLALQYGGGGLRHPRENDPYCSSSGQLDSVIYFTDSGVFEMCVVCDGTGQAPSTLLEGVTLSVDPVNVSSEWVELVIVLDDDMAARNAESEFNFVVASRDAVRSL